MDKYTKIVLTIIAICLIALNIRVWVPEKVNAVTTKWDYIDDFNFKDAVNHIVSRECYVSDASIGIIRCRGT